jgi:hypothetical protein
MELIKDKNGKVQWKKMLETIKQELVEEYSAERKALPTVNHDLGSKSLDTLAKEKTVAEVIAHLRQFPEDAVFKKNIYVETEYISFGLFDITLETDEMFKKRAERKAAMDIEFLKRSYKRKEELKKCVANQERLEYERLKKKFEGA